MKSATQSPALARIQNIVLLLENLDSDRLRGVAVHALLLEQLCNLREEYVSHAEVRSLGYVKLNAEEKTLVENLRWTRHKGRDKVYRLAEQMRLQKPW